MLCISLATLLWRLLDFLEEATAGSVKMSLGPLLITGYSAAIMQLAIITVLLIAIYKTTAWLLRKQASIPLG